LSSLLTLASFSAVRAVLSTCPAHSSPAVLAAVLPWQAVLRGQASNEVLTLEGAGKALGGSCIKLHGQQLKELLIRCSSSNPLSTSLQCLHIYQNVSKQINAFNIFLVATHI